jgi:CubicO group peptidase (beta-lactamase class C family)
VPGVSIAVINDGRVEWAGGYGIASSTTAAPVTPETLFQAAYSSQAVSAMGALALVQDRRLDLDAPVNHSLHTWKIPENEYTSQQQVTLRHLLAHTGGLTVHGFSGYRRVDGLPSLLQILDGIPPAHSDPVRVAAVPGTQESFSSGGYCILQLLMEETAGLEFPDLIRDLVLQPVGMENSTFRQPLPEDLRDRAAVGHDQSGTRLPEGWRTFPEVAAAGLWTTPTEMARFVVHLYESLDGRLGAVLNPELARLMVIPDSAGTALGFSSNEDGSVISKNNASAGFFNSLFTYIEEGKGAVLMANSGNSVALFGEIYRGIAEEYEWADHRPRVKMPVALEEEALRAWEGEYLLAGLQPLTIQWARVELQARIGSQPPFTVLPESMDRLFGIEVGFEFEAVRDDAGKIIELLAQWQGQEARSPRVRDR